MTWNGLLTPEGTGRIICDTDLDEPAIPPPSIVAAAMFSGETIYKVSTTPGMPFVALGLNDFSMEWFIHGRTVDSLAGLEHKVHSGLVVPISGDTEGQLQNGLDVGDIDVGPAQVLVFSGVTTGVTIAIGNTSWAHVAMSVDRAGLVTFYLNDSVDTTRDASAGSAIDFPAVPVHPMMGENPLRQTYDSLDDNHDIVDSSQHYLSSFAIHNRQLTPTEVSDAFAAKVVNNLAGATFVRYLFARFVDSVGTPVTPAKETTLANISLGCKDRIAEPQNSELFSPIAAPGTLFLEDSSGNGGHWPLLTKSSYSDVNVANRAINGFATTGAS